MSVDACPGAAESAYLWPKWADAEEPHHAPRVGPVATAHQPAALRPQALRMAQEPAQEPAQTGLRPPAAGRSEPAVLRDAPDRRFRTKK
jgi:hypothetical protein